MLRLLYFKAHGVYPHYYYNPVRSVNLQKKFALESLKLSYIIFLRKQITGELDFPFVFASVEHFWWTIEAEETILFSIQWKSM